ncbi:hypothetical protein HK101_009557 [Irineochytrium annulatum]|nr:hypothetical protein HK101_009557 [Irineochytrium annulatum]
MDSTTASSTPPKARSETPRRRFVGAGRSAKAKEAARNADDGLASTGGGGNIEDAPATTSFTVVKKPASGGAPRIANQVPDEILGDVDINAAIAQLPSNYNFEIHKTIWQIRKYQATNVALQFPEGLLMYSLAIADILERFTACSTVVMGDVTYGACCVDDFTALALGCDLLVHYGHSCLVPVDVTSIRMLYVFVDVTPDVDHLVNTLLLNFPAEANIVMVATIQFVAALQVARKRLEGHFANLHVPQARPLSPGEVLGCTAPKIDMPASSTPPTLIYLGDGRFHLEAIMIANPTLRAFRYDPYSKRLTRERYDHATMRRLRTGAVDAARGARNVGLIMGTLGRQGSPKVHDHLRRLIAGPVAKDGPAVGEGRSVVTVLLSEITPAKLDMFGPAIECWVQTSCPRLSIDWGHGFSRPLLSPYEMTVAMGGVEEGRWMVRDGGRGAGKEMGENELTVAVKEGDGAALAVIAGDDLAVEEGNGAGEVAIYPMDYYARNSLGPWTPNHVPGGEKKASARKVGAAVCSTKVATVTA